MILLKVFKKGLISPYQNMQYKSGIIYSCPDFCDDKNIDCAKGHYATDWDGLSYTYRKGRNVYTAEVGGKKVEYNQFKRRYEKIEILNKLTIKEIKEGLKKNSAKAGYDLYKTSFPHNPLGKENHPTQKDIENLKKWISVDDTVCDSVCYSVSDTVYDTVCGSVGDTVCDSVFYSVSDTVYDTVCGSVGDTVCDSVFYSVGASVNDSIFAYISSIFFNIKKWKHIDHTEGENPFQPCIDLWNRNFVPSFDGKTWRLHTGKDAKIVYKYEV